MVQYTVHPLTKLSQKASPAGTASRSASTCLVRPVGEAVATLRFTWPMFLFVDRLGFRCPLSVYSKLTAGADKNCSCVHQQKYTF